jgi:hypothetical protein
MIKILAVLLGGILLHVSLHAADYIRIGDSDPTAQLIPLQPSSYVEDAGR